MPDTELEPPFPAYAGTAPFIFVGYSHKDAATVFPELQELHDRGYRIWYDEGIDPGNEWSREIARALNASALFIVFISPNAVVSRNVRKEIRFALDKSKPFLAVHICKTELDEQMQFDIGDMQAVLQYRMSPHNYRRKMELALPATLRDTPVVPPPPESRQSPDRSATPATRNDQLVIDLGSGIKMEFVLIRPGTFQMGEKQSAHKVTLTKPFYLGKYLVTQEQWERAMGSNPSLFKGAKNPVERVSWEDCQTFIRKLGEKIPGQTFRLPTEAEWEYACRAGSTTEYCYGDDAGGLGEYAWYGGNSGSKTHPVGEKKPNAWGLYDMHGNVWEWCADWYGNYDSNAATDPTGPSSGSGRVLRGGSWSNYATHCRSARRNYSDPSSRNDLCGVRVVVMAR